MNKTNGACALGYADGSTLQAINLSTKTLGAGTVSNFRHILFPAGIIDLRPGASIGVEQPSYGIPFQFSDKVGPMFGITEPWKLQERPTAPATTEPAAKKRRTEKGAPKTGASVKCEGKSASSASAPDDFVHDLTWDAASVADAKSSVAGSVISSLFGGHQVGEDILKAFNFEGSFEDLRSCCYL